MTELNTPTERSVNGPDGAVKFVEDEPAGRPVPTDADALLHQAEAAYLIGVSPRTMEAWRHRGGGPVFVSISRRAIRYRRGDVLSWIEARRRRSTSDTGSTAGLGR
jgi:hypothetical protein